MEYKEFENHLSRSLANHTATVNIASLLESIHLSNKRKRRTAIYLWLLTGVMIGLTLLGLFFYNGSNNANSKKNIFKHKETTCDVNGSFDAQNHTSQTLNEGQSSYSAVRESINASNTALSSNRIISPVRYVKYDISTDQRNNKLSSDEESIENIVSPAFDDRDITKNESKVTNYAIGSLSSLPLGPLEIRKDKIGIDKVICPSFKINKGYGLKVALIPEIGIFLPLKKLETSNSESEVFQSRRASEKSLEGLDAALHARVHLGSKSNLYGQVGVSYSLLTERMTKKYSIERVDTIIGIISITKSQNGDTITTIYGPIYQTSRISGTKVRHYNLSMWDIPIGIGYEMPLGVFDLGIEGGINLNLSLRSKGNIYQQDTLFANVQDVGNPVFKKRLGPSYYAGLSLSYPMGSGKWYINSRMRYISDQFNQENNSIRQYYHFTGINLGYIRRF
jgi:hypothetical protein